MKTGKRQFISKFAYGVLFCFAFSGCQKKGKNRTKMMLDGVEEEYEYIVSYPMNSGLDISRRLPLGVLAFLTRVAGEPVLSLLRFR